MSKKKNAYKRASKRNQLIIAVLVALVVVAGVFFLLQSLNKPNTPAPVPTQPSQTVSVTPTESSQTPTESQQHTTAPPDTSETSTTPSVSTEPPETTSSTNPPVVTPPQTVTYDSILKTLSHEMFDGENAFILINDNKPFFTKSEITTKSFESYGELDRLGRCTMCWSSVGRDLMPTEKRESSLSSVSPSGWKYNGKSNNREYDFVDGRWVYNRCHLIGWQLTGENANKYNLVTGTRYLNIDGMLSFENMIADAVKEKNLHVMYRVTPVFKGDNLVCEGLLLEGYSVEDNGKTIEFCVFSPNVQPGVEINYATGQNWLK